MMSRILIVLSFLYLASCAVKNDIDQVDSLRSNHDTTVSEVIQPKESSDSATPASEEFRRDNIPPISKDVFGEVVIEEIKGIGLITFVDFPASMKVYNEDASVWKNLFLVDKSSPFFHLVSGIEPRISANGYERLLFDCTKIKGDWYEVIINDSSGLKKYLHMDSDSSFVFETWDKFILNQCLNDGIRFDPSTNPPRESPDQSSKIISTEYNYARTVNYARIANKKKGDWVKIELSDTEPLRYGWIRWRKDNRLIIDFGGNPYPILR